MFGFHTSVATAIKAGAMIAAVSALVVQPYRVMVVSGLSMAPTYANHSVLLTEPVRPDQLKRGMVVIVSMDGGPIVKRIAYLPGDQILQARLGHSWFDMVHMKPLDARALGLLHWRRLTIPQGQVFLLGDNFSLSVDSRRFGCVSMSKITCRLIDQRPRVPE